MAYLQIVRNQTHVQQTHQSDASNQAQKLVSFHIRFSKKQQTM